MKVVGTKSVNVEQIRKPGNWREICGSVDVAQRAESIREVGLIHPPLLRRKDGALEIVAGRRRVAAHDVMKLPMVEARIVECSDAEARRLARVENLEREHLTQEQRQALRREHAADLAADMVSPHDVEKPPAADPKPGRPKSPERAARKQAAKDLGVSEETIRRAQVTDAPAKPETPAPRLETWGVAVDAALLTEADAVLDALEEVDAKLRAAQAALTKLAGAGLGFVPQSIARALQTTAAMVRGARPQAVCPYCKAQEALRPKCPACGGFGYVTQDGLADVPAELKASGPEAMVSVDGRFRKVAA